MFGDRMCSSYIRELEEWLSMFTYDYEIAEVTKVLNAPYIYKVKVIEFSPDCSYENSYRYDLFITTSGDIKNEDGDSVLNAEANNCAGDITILEFIRNFRVKWFGEEKNNINNINVADCKVTRQQFLNEYYKELDIKFNEDEEIADKAHIYGYPITVHWNGIYCDCGDGATPSNYIIPAIEECESELDDEDEKGDDKRKMKNQNENILTRTGFVLTSDDISSLEVDLEDEWMYPNENDNANVALKFSHSFKGDDLFGKFANELGMATNDILDVDGYMDIYADLDVIEETVTRLYIIAKLPDEDIDAYLYFDIDDMGKQLYSRLYDDNDSFKKFLKECEKMIRDMEKAKTNETEVKNFMEALDIFQKAFENLADYTGDYYIKDEWWDGKDNYPFNWSFEEMPGIIEVWVEGVKDNVRKASEPVIKYETNYSAEADRTFIMKCTYKGNDCIREECVGFYAGEPDEANKTEDFIGDLVAEYNWD